MTMAALLMFSKIVGFVFHPATVSPEFASMRTRGAYAIEYFHA